MPMSHSFPPVVLFTFMLAALPLTSHQALCQEEGLFADFKTNQGNFTARLEMEKTPRTVANFAGLASGVIPWVDLVTGQVRTDPYYNGNTFHRVIADFVIQAGSLSGEGTDGPGYTFKDEIDPSLRHDRPYILSMANSGPNSNGSQFFITLSEAPHLDDKHAVFGEVISGTEVIDLISKVPVGEFDQPTEDQIIESITIRRVGEAAEAFDLLGQGLPVAQEARPFVVYPAPGEVAIDFSRSSNSGMAIYRSDDLQTWTGDLFSYASGVTPLDRLDITGDIASTDQRFYRFIDVSYPDVIHTPPSAANRKIVLDITSHNWTMLLDMDETGTSGQFAWENAELDTIKQASWLQEAHRGVLTAEFPPETIVPIRVHLGFDTETSGTFRGTVFNSIPFDINGTFTAEKTGS